MQAPVPPAGARADPHGRRARQRALVRCLPSARAAVRDPAEPDEALRRPRDPRQAPERDLSPRRGQRLRSPARCCRPGRVDPGGLLEDSAADGSKYEPIEVRVVACVFPKVGKAKRGRTIDGWEVDPHAERRGGRVAALARRKSARAASTAASAASMSDRSPSATARGTGAATRGSVGRSSADTVMRTSADSNRSAVASSRRASSSRQASAEGLKRNRAERGASAVDSAVWAALRSG